MAIEKVCLSLRVAVKEVSILQRSYPCLVAAHSFDDGTQTLVASTRLTADDISDTLVINLATSCLHLLLESPEPSPVTITVGSSCFLPCTRLPPTDSFGCSIIPRLVESAGSGKLGWNTILESFLKKLLNLTG